MFIAGFVVLYLFALIMVPKWHRPPYRPHQKPWIIPGEPRNLLQGQTHRVYEGFEGPDATFYMFGVDWCPHCVAAKPEFMNLGSTKTIAGQNIEFRNVNPELQPDAAKGFAIDGYPTFYLQRKDGSLKKYTGSRDQQGFESFLQDEFS
jgi:thiol-disulfide isomerase/thioredoxin